MRSRPLIGITRPVKSPLAKRSVVIAGHKTAVSLEEPFWVAVKAIAALKRVPVSRFIEEIDQRRDQTNLSSAIRLFVLDFFKSHVVDDGISPS